jgi:hypothetical protein
VTETFTPEKIKEFILSHIESGKWHLVLQFIAGLLGKKNGYKDCVLAFAESFVCDDSILDVDDNRVLFVMKCLREVDDEDTVREACETTTMNDVVSLSLKGRATSTSSDWAAVTFVCKHMKKLTTVFISLAVSSEEYYLEINKLLLQRCIKQLKFLGNRLSNLYFEAGHLFKALMKSNCPLKHEHVKLTELDIRHLRATDGESLLTMCDFFKNGHASCLKKFSVPECEISSRGVSILCEVLDNKLCPELTCMDLSYNSILDEGVAALCNALIEQKLFTLTELFLSHCSLTDECVPSLCELLRDKRCNLTGLSLTYNKGIRAEGLRMLCRSALTMEHCKLTKLRLPFCSLTDECIPDLREALQDEHCVLNELRLDGNMFTEEGEKSLREIETHEHCKARGLEVRVC